MLKVGLGIFGIVLMAALAFAWSRTVQPDVDALIDGYIAAWFEPDVSKREKLLAKVFAEKATYTDERVNIKSHQELAGYIGSVMKNVPAGGVMSVSKAQVHHGTFRFAWRYALPDGTVFMEGMDFGELSGEGRIQRLVVFAGTLPVRPNVK